MLLVQRGSRFIGFTPKASARSIGRAASSATRAPCARRSTRCATASPGSCASPRSRPRWRWWRSSPRLSRAPSRRALHDLVAHLDRDPHADGKSRDRCRPHLSRQRAARPRQRGAALSGALPAAHRRPTRRSATATRVTWAEVAQVPLCLLTPDMQNRRIIDGLLRAAGGESQPTLESNSMIVLFAHVRTGRWASVMPARLAETLGLTATIRAIPIVEPEAVHTIGLVVPPREPMTPLTAGAGGGSEAAGGDAERLRSDCAVSPIPIRRAPPARSPCPNAQSRCRRTGVPHRAAATPSATRLRD